MCSSDLLTILTAARTGEVVGATWDEIKDDVWTIPAERMKGGKEHRVPLSAPALRILDHQRRFRENEFVFPGRLRKGMSPATMLALLWRMDCDFTVHGFRSSFRDWAAETTNYANHVVEMALAHVVGSRVEAAYRRGDLFEKRRRLMHTWAEYLARPAATGEVVPLRR